MPGIFMRSTIMSEIFIYIYIYIYINIYIYIYIYIYKVIEKVAMPSFSNICYTFNFLICKLYYQSKNQSTICYTLQFENLQLLLIKLNNL